MVRPRTCGSGGAPRSMMIAAPYSGHRFAGPWANGSRRCRQSRVRGASPVGRSRSTGRSLACFGRHPWLHGLRGASPAPAVRAQERPQPLLARPRALPALPPRVDRAKRRAATPRARGALADPRGVRRGPSQAPGGRGL